MIVRNRNFRTAVVDAVRAMGGDVKWAETCPDKMQHYVRVIGDAAERSGRRVHMRITTGNNVTKYMEFEIEILD